MEAKRPNPEAILKNLLEQEQKKGQGRLKIFFGYAAGVGKTYAMLKEAHELLQDGVDVVVGYVEPHQRPKTLELLEGLPAIEPLWIKLGEGSLREFDLDAALARHPAVIIVDELAHTNLRGCRHNKRYQDVQELLRMGIDVYTTVNVQHLEGLHDLIESITGIEVRERIPDYIFDSADKVEVVDLEPDDLVARLNRGEIYHLGKVKRALTHFFTNENLVALREIALRRTADRLNIAIEKNKQLGTANYSVSEHVLMCLSGSPSNAKVVRTAAKMAEAFHGSLTALFVKDSGFEALTDEDRTRLNANIKLAEQLGARVVTVYGDDIAYQVAEYAKLSGTTKLVLGRSPERNFFGFRTSGYVDRLTAYAPNLDIYVIPNKLTPRYYSKPRAANADYLAQLSWAELTKVLLCMSLATALGYVFSWLGFSEISIITIYIFAALSAAAITNGRIYAVFAALLSIGLFSFLFVEPLYSFVNYKTEYNVTFVIMLLSTLTMGVFSRRAREQRHLVSQNSYRTEMLLETSKKLQAARGSQEIFNTIIGQLQKSLERRSLLYPIQDGMLAAPLALDDDYSGLQEYLKDYELAVASWVQKNGREAGAGTDTLAAAKGLYLPVKNNTEVLAVVCLVMEGLKPLQTFEKGLLYSMLLECGLAIENDKLLSEKEQLYMNASHVQLRSGITLALMQELNTPLSNISNNVDMLRQEWQNLDEASVQKLLRDISEQTVWMNKTLANMQETIELQANKPE